MADSNKFAFYQAKLSQSEFDRLSKFIFEQSGIKLPQVKLIMLQSRLQKRLKELNFTTYKEYIDYVFSAIGLENEIVHMLDVVSTNKTDFYREPVHFEFLETELLPQLFKLHGRGTFKVWSAGCSSGEEPYTLAIVLQEFKEKNPGFDYQVLATDISTQMLQTGANAVYKEEKISIIPLSIKKKYFLRSKDHNDPRVRVVKTLRDKVSFQRLNFMDNTYQVNDQFDIIFCRNALIYFERENQEMVINKLCQKLKPEGFFLLGHSESITNMNVPLKSIKPTIFKKT